ncbi:nuclear transport factor 2 family protein, partial [Bradyrhizobium sp. AS23.2]|uniref:nuclear transport factor 2 family protein n=1 Tax=Bradyrhizobium sp. AS23.2 TaxID=1680155 RepID=UPI00095CBB14
MSFDPMAVAIDWLDAYRSGDIEIILALYADDAVVHYGCQRVTVTGKEALRAYWADRLRKYPASDLDNLQPSQDGTVISYVTASGMISAALTFNTDGQIAAKT